MGPRSTDRGNAMERGKAAGSEFAAMGPRSTDRGNYRVGPTHAGAKDASMGPRSTDRGNYPLLVLLLSPKRLQWGRDRLIAEIFGRPVLAAGCGFASMGPRSTDRGNDPRPPLLPGGISCFNGAAID